MLTFYGFIRVVAVGVVWKYIGAIGVLFSGTPKTIITGLGFFASLFSMGFASQRYSKNQL
ncbi:MAG: hypothetical protein K9W46_14100 [Candidatus Heimdallarchaeum endolithica]|uniref:Uncharacterized protein n=1 Tax=Candidatus Heimdallarchaeum endolithica TaxID=2876572 RepID=A0A9Y1BR94_9ARCH|nr:MAG: hypothetical protein K9W46_14100 [Candidatus Heimdallarchaeum endolithica]